MLDHALMPLGATPFRLPNPALAMAGHSWNSPAWNQLPTEIGARLLNNALFRNGEQGGYWPADPAYWRDDSAGTIAASVNGVCGLWLDALRGLELGQELTTNGTFDTDTFWNKTGAATISGGVGHLVGSSSIEKALGHTANAAYQVTYAAMIRGGSVRAQMVGVLGYTRTVSGTHSEIITPASTGTTYFVGVAGTDVDIDNVSVRQLLGNHAIQATTGNKPIVRLTSKSGRYWLDAGTANAAMTVTFPSSLGSACTIARVTPEGVTFTENQTITSTYNLTPPYGYNSDVLMINRALTPAEKALVTKVFRRNAPMLSGLLKNSGFDDGTGLTVVGVTFNGTAVVDNTVVGFPIVFSVNLPAGSYYTKIEVLGITNASGGFSLRVADVYSTNAIFSTGIISGVCVTTISGGFALVKRGATSWAGTVDNMTVQEII